MSWAQIAKNMPIAQPALPARDPTDNDAETKGVSVSSDPTRHIDTTPGASDNGGWDNPLNLDFDGTPLPPPKKTCARRRIPDEELFAGLEGTAVTCPRRLVWVLQKKAEIQALHSSKEMTDVFVKECAYCYRWYKHCMFSNLQRRADNPMCRWCQADYDEAGPLAYEFQIHLHIHCNRPGKKICGQNRRI
jgi:hypothetical protein